jgi:hypothetical protein
MNPKGPKTMVVIPLFSQTPCFPIEVTGICLYSNECKYLCGTCYTYKQQTIHLSTPVCSGLYDITWQVEAIVTESGVQTGMVNVYVQGATAGIMM